MKLKFLWKIYASYVTIAQYEKWLEIRNSLPELFSNSKQASIRNKVRKETGFGEIDLLTYSNN